jgi:hypothetical protein
MKSTKTIPLTDAEIRAGLERLRSSALIKVRDAEWAADLTCNFKLNVGLPISELTGPYGIEKGTACVIQDLAVALVTKRLMKEETFRLGTSPEAMQLFEAECDEWNDPRGWRFAKNAAVTS